jgi:hypothetical protein
MGVAVRYPTRYRTVPHGREAFVAFHAECLDLLQRATELDAAQQALAVELAEVRTKLAEMRVVMWPRVDPKDIVRGFRRTVRGGSAPIPPEAPNAQPVGGVALRSAVLQVLALNDRPMTLVEIHRELHLNGRAIVSRQPVQRLADCLGLEHRKGRACRVERGVYRLGVLNPAERRRVDKSTIRPIRTR